MKVSEIPRFVFYTFAASLCEELEVTHLGGKRIIAPLATSDGWVVLNEHPKLFCSSCKLFVNLKSALKDCWPTCSVQVGPQSVGWDENEGRLKRELRASFLVRGPTPPLEAKEKQWASMVQTTFSTLNVLVQPEAYMEANCYLIE